MKKKLLVSLLIVNALVGLIGCGNSNNNKTKIQETSKQEQKQEVKKWNPEEVAELNKVYRDKSNKNLDGSYLIINVSGIEKSDNTIKR